MSNVPVAPRLISIREAAEALGISRAGLYAALGRGEIPTVKIGGRRLVRVADLDAYVANLA